jgi:gliding motility-associated-like protein
LVECDVSGGGSAQFNLDLATPDVLNGQTGITVTYYGALTDAQTGTGPLNSPYTNTTNPQTLYVRLEDNATNCYTTTTLELVVDPLPTANPPTALEVCDDNTDGLAQFDLTSRDTQVLNGQVGMVVTYHATQAAADAGSAPLSSPYTNTSNPQTIYARIEDSSTGCYGTTTLDLMVSPLPAIAPISDFILCDDDDPGDGQELFDLTIKDVEASNGQANIAVAYYASQTDADTGTGALTSPYQNTVSPQTIYVGLTNTFTGCVTTTSFILKVNPLPTLIDPTPLQVCDDNVGDGFTPIDLTLRDTEITGGNPQYTVSYHLSQSDADINTAPLASPYTNTSNPQTIYVRVESTTTGCHATTTLELEVEQAPVANVPSPLEYCDADSDGFGVFTLTDADPQVTGGVGGLTVTYHETMADAGNNVNAQTGPYNNIVAYMQTIYVRIESATIATDCATIVELQLIVKDTPQIADPTALEVCDDTADGFARFDLTIKNPEILDGLDAAQYAVSYYLQQADADVPTNAIATPNAYTNTVAFNQTLWVRVDDTANGCYKLTTLELIVNALPVLVQPTPLTLCDVNSPGDQMEAFTLEDANAQILNGQTGITLTYHATQPDASTGANPLVSPYINTTNAQTIYVRAVTNTTGCTSTITLDLRVNPLPSLVAPAPINVCDGDNDGFASFSLDIRTLQIINGETNISVTYHETMADADSGQNALAGPYDNIVANTQTVFARKQNTVTDCYRVIPLTLNVRPSPEVPTGITDYVVCDTNSDGFAQFDLTGKSAEILGGQSPSQYTLTYHVSQATADTGASPIANPANYTNTANPQTIYVRLVGVGNGCVKTGQFEIRVELPPTAVQPSPLNLCDDGVADQMTVFDLTVKDIEITGGNGSWTVSYYTTSADAQANANVIALATAYTNMSVGGSAANPQTLYVRVTDGDTGCTDFATLTIRVLPNPTPGTAPPDMVLCDDINTGDAQEEFDLTANQPYIINGETGVTPTFHTTLEDAQDGTSAIGDPTMYTNTSTPQTIYVRVTNDITDCYTIVDFDIIVNPLPAVVAVTDYILCEVNTDGFAQFDLTSKNAEVLNGQPAALYSVTYHATQMGADNLTGALVSPYANTGNPQQIYVAITNTLTGCSISTPSFNIEVDNAAVANPPLAPYTICDNIGDNDGLGQFDLTTQDAGILGSLQDPVDFIVTYYATQADAEQGVEPIPYTYENISSPQVIYVRVDNDTPDAAGMDSSVCYAVAELTLRVDLNPIFSLDDSYTLCVDTNGTEVLGPAVLDTGLSPTDYTFEWGLDGEVLPGETGPSLTAGQGGTYSVVVTNNATTCTDRDSAEVMLSSPPTVNVGVGTQAFSENHVITATATGDGEYEYSLDGGPWQQSGTFEGVSFGEHTVAARDINGCGEAEGSVTLMDYPHFFTPNGDGRNETWNIVGFAGQASAKIYIFDRFGKLLKQISPSGTGWNGTYNGRPVPTSDYWFTVEYSEPSTGEQKQFRAHFTLKR